MRLYYAPGSPFARVARIVALELKAPCEMVEESEFPPKQVEAFNPAMQVPTLVDGGRSLFGTRLIAEYLMTEYSNGGSSAPLPLAARTTRPEQRWRDAQVLVALEALLSSLVTRSYLIWTGVKHRLDAAIPMDLESREEMRIYRLLDWLEEEASADGFLPGVFSLQEIWLISTIGWTEARIPIEWRGRPKLEAILASHATRQTVQATIPSPWSSEN